jgi:uncharacterized protein YjbI with pentapeptide repeats
MKKKDHCDDSGVGGSTQNCQDSLAIRRLRVIFTLGEKQLLAGGVFSDMDLDNVDFSGADLREASFNGVSLEGSDFSEANLSGARFLECDLRGASFERAIFHRTSFHKSWLIGVTGLSQELRDYVCAKGGLLWPC